MEFQGQRPVINISLKLSVSEASCPGEIFFLSLSFFFLKSQVAWEIGECQKIQLTFQDENIINSIDLDHNLLPLSSTKRIGNLKNNVFCSLTWLSLFSSFPSFPSSSPYPHLLPPPPSSTLPFPPGTFSLSCVGEASHEEAHGVRWDCWRRHNARPLTCGASVLLIAASRPVILCLSRTAGNISAIPVTQHD